MTALPPTADSGEPTALMVTGLLALVAVLFGVVPLSLAWLWARFVSPPKPGAAKNSTYECGLEARGDAWIRIRSHYYLYAILFLVFDVEIVFLLPFAVAFTGLPAGAFVAILIFLLLLLEGLVWAWQKGLLIWEAASARGSGRD